VKPALTWLALGLLALMLESVLAAAFPLRLVPDLPLLMTAGMALALKPGPGLVAAGALGLATDMASGALLGTHAFARLLEFALSRLLASKLDLRRGVPLAVFALGLQALDGALLLGVSQLFFPGFRLVGGDVLDALARCLPTAILAPTIGALAKQVVEWQSKVDARREMRLETRRRIL